jgi:hypothetical protein
MTPSAAGDIADLSLSTFSYLWQLPTSMASWLLSPAINLSRIVVTCDKFITGITGINNTSDH